MAGDESIADRVAEEHLVDLIPEDLDEAPGGGFRRLRSRLGAVAEWMLLAGDRRIVTGVLLVGIFVTLVLLSLIRPIELRQLLSEEQTVSTLFNTLLSGIILLISIVVSVNAVVVSQELSSIGTQEERIQNAMAFRRHTNALLGEELVSVAQPASFLGAITRAVGRLADELRTAVEDVDDEETAETLATFADRVGKESRTVTKTLEDGQFATFDILEAGLHYDYSWQLDVGPRLQHEYEETLPESVLETVDDLVETLELFAIALGYFKTLYYQWEFANLSSDLLYSGLPAIVGISYVLLSIGSKAFPGEILGIPNIFLFFSAAFTAALVPFVVLMAYSLRAATVTKKTLAAGPFHLQRQAAEVTVFEQE